MNHFLNLNQGITAGHQNKWKMKICTIETKNMVSKVALLPLPKLSNSWAQGLWFHWALLVM